MPNNPFSAFLHSDPPRVIGRDYLIQELLDGVTRPAPQSFQITSLRTMGASALLRYLAHPQGALANQTFKSSLHPPFDESERLLFFHFDFLHALIDRTLPGWLYDHISRDPRLTETIGPLDGANDTPAVGLQRIFLQLKERGRRVILLFDHFDRALERLPKEEALELRPLVGLVAFVTSTERPLVEIQPDAASSLFAGQLSPLTLEPLGKQDARELVRTALNDPKLSTKEYEKLLPLTGTYPYFLLMGAAELYDLLNKADRGQLREPERLELLRYRLVNRFHGEFVRFWNHLSDAQRAALTALTAEPQTTEWSAVQRRQLNALLDKGLVVLSGRGYAPFSELWGEFVQRRAPSPDPTAVSPKSRFTRREAELLDYLRQRPQRLCTYGDILHAVWVTDDTEANRHRLRQFVARLRKKLDEAPTAEGSIVNQRDQGYLFQPTGETDGES